MAIYTLHCASDNTGMSGETNHSLFVTGHTFLPHDWVLEFIETKPGKTGIVKHARVKQPFTVVQMKNTR